MFFTVRHALSSSQLTLALYTGHISHIMTVDPSIIDLAQMIDRLIALEIASYNKSV
jgi:hypothetical protein